MAKNWSALNKEKAFAKNLIAWRKSENAIVKIQNLCYNDVSPLEDIDEIRRYKNDRNFE